MSQILAASSIWLHALATIILIGHYLLLTLIYLPVLANNKTDQTGGMILSAISKRSRNWMYVSLLIFIITGIYLTWVDQCRGGRCARVRPPASESAAVSVELSLPLAAAAAQGYRIVDLREPLESSREPIRGVECLRWPLARLLDEGPSRLDRDTRYLLVCSKGTRSRSAAETLRAAGFEGVFSLSGGLAGQPAGLASA